MSGPGTNGQNGGNAMNPTNWFGRFLGWWSTPEVSRTRMLTSRFLFDGHEQVMPPVCSSTPPVTPPEGQLKQQKEAEKQPPSDPKNTVSESRDRQQTTVISQLEFAVAAKRPATGEQKSVPVSGKIVEKARSYADSPHRRPSESAETAAEWCAQNGGRLFEDAEFSATADLIVPDPQVQWKRPTELVDAPTFGRVELPLRHDVDRPLLGTSAFLSALSIVSERPELLQRVVPSGQTFEKTKYNGEDTDRNVDERLFVAGSFHFNLWFYGHWQSLVVDDRLPVRTDGVLHSQPTNGTDFLVPLLEKALAKLIGSYSSLIAFDHETFAFLCLTGGMNSELAVREASGEHARLEREFRSGGVLMMATTKSGAEVEHLGLRSSQHYGLCGFETIGDLRLVKVLNPWRAESWKGVDVLEKVADEKKRSELKSVKDGQFWISWEDFLRLFDRLQRLFLAPELLDVCLEGGNVQPPISAAFRSDFVSVAPEFNWVVITNAWRRKLKTAGGAPGVPQNQFHRNPQYVATISSATEQPLPVLFHLFRKQRGGEAAATNSPAFGLFVFRVPEEEAERTRKFDASFFTSNPPVFYQRVFSHEICCGRFVVEPGTYLLVPTAHQPNAEGDFFLRVFVKGKVVVVDLV
ncbi:Calpain-8 isoform X4 [Aphelenchoides fujianensis]|nr:Calpain-8 isoform X4 [Aphelenchoides fujianensis]